MISLDPFMFQLFINHIRIEAGDAIIEEGEGIKIQILSPVVRDKKGQHKDVLEDLQNKGFGRQY